MFSKSKRFPEVGKDYIPGPGEYEVVLDDSSPYKRHGFISQTSRFSDVLELPNSPTDLLASNQRSGQSYKSDSTTTTTSSLSLSSTTSSIKSLLEDSAIRSLTTSTSSSNKKLHSPTSPETPIVSNHFEKHKYAMQKEIETLQTKTRRLELQIQTLENEKNDSKSMMLTKDLELADLRSKNTTLQKTINRQEVSSKMSQLQKKIELLEQQLKTTVAEKDKQLEKTINEHAQKQENMETQIHELTAKLAASEHTKDMQINQIQCMSEQIHNLSSEKDMLTDKVDELREETAQLQSRVSLKDEEIDDLLNKMDEKDTEIEQHSNTIHMLQSRFNEYREYMEKTVISHLRAKRQEIDEHQLKEFNRVVTELYEAKKFINKQAQQMDGLKSDVHWLTVHNSQLNKLAIAMNGDYKAQTISSRKKKRTTKKEQDESSNKILNDSGFCTLSDY